jgi:hypothetical protein
MENPSRGQVRKCVFKNGKKSAKEMAQVAERVFLITTTRNQKEHIFVPIRKSKIV